MKQSTDLLVGHESSVPGVLLPPASHPYFTQFILHLLARPITYPRWNVTTPFSYYWLEISTKVHWLPIAATLLLGTCIEWHNNVPLLWLLLSIKYAVVCLRLHVICPRKISFVLGIWPYRNKKSTKKLTLLLNFTRTSTSYWKHMLVKPSSTT